MVPESITPLVLFALISTITPGAATIMATASGAQFGFSRSIPVMAGSAFGLASIAAASAAGLAGIMMAAPSLQSALKVAGSAYLLWLAWKVANGGRPEIASRMPDPVGFAGGASLLWLNPKGWAMSLGAAASFGAGADGPLQLALLLGSILGGAAAVSLCLWCLSGMLLARLLRSETQWRVFNRALGLLLAASIAQMWRA